MYSIKTCLKDQNHLKVKVTQYQGQIKGNQFLVQCNGNFWWPIQRSCLLQIFLRSVLRGWYGFDWKAFLLPTAYVVWGKVMFWHMCVHLSVCPQGVPHLARQGGTPARSSWGESHLGVPHLGGGTSARSSQGVPQPGRAGRCPSQVQSGVSKMGYPTGRNGVSPSQVRMRGTQDGVPSSRDGVHPLARSGWGVPEMGYP